MKVSQKRCPGTSIEGFTASSPSEQIIVKDKLFRLIFQLLTLQSCFISDPFLLYKSVNRHC